ncbi:hypothetical protein GGF38_000063 [Coemansia sp. RSA 25]|nr:hypothetical protein GGF38_000063 [Coemansia sp. RSA 25]
MLKKQEEKQWAETNDKQSIIRPILWAASFTTCAYYVTIESYAQGAIKTRSLADESSKPLDSRTVRSISEVVGEPFLVLVNKMAAWCKAMGTHQAAAKEGTPTAAFSLDSLYESTLANADYAIQAVDGWYKTLNRSECYVYGIVALNTVVFVMWGSRRLTPFMKRCFVHDPRSKRSFTMLTSIFSHREYWHLLANNFMLLMFSAEVIRAGGPEQFTFLYLSAGVLTNLAAHLSMVLSKRIVTCIPLIGAGGTLYSLVGLFWQLPSSQLLYAISFLPYMIMLVPQVFPQRIGLYHPESKAKWRPTLCITHVAGALLGVAYMKWGTGRYSQDAKKRISQLASAATK